MGREERRLGEYLPTPLRQEPEISDPGQSQGFWEGDPQPQNAAAFLEESAPQGLSLREVQDTKEIF